MATLNGSSTGQHIHPPPPPKDLSTPGWSSVPLAPGVTKTSSPRRTQDTAPGEPQALPERPLPRVPGSLNESRETPPSDMKRSYEPLNTQLTPNEVTSPPTAVHSNAPSFAVTNSLPRTPPKAVVTRLNPPSLPQVDFSSSEYSHGASESRDKSETPDSEAIIDETAVVETSPTTPPPAVIRPTNDIVREVASSSSMTGPIVNKASRHTPGPTVTEARTSSRRTGSTSSSASRQPRMEDSHGASMSTQSREASQPQLERGGTMGAPPPAYETAVTQPTPMAEEKRSTSTGIESERPLPRTPPMAESNAPVKDQPVRIEYRHPLDHNKDDPSRNPPNQTLSGSNAERTHAAQPEPAPQERGPVAEERPPTSASIESERPRTPPAAPSNAPIKEQPVRTEYRHPLDHSQGDPPRKLSNQTPSGSNAAHTRAAQSAQASQDQGEEGRQLAQAGSMPSEQANQKPKKLFFCC